MPSRSEMQMAHPGVETRDEDWRAFFRTQIWKDLKLIFTEDYEYGTDLLVGDSVQDTNEINKLRGKVKAYKEMRRMGDNILAIINGSEKEPEEEPDEEKTEEDELG